MKTIKLIITCSILLSIFGCKKSENIDEEKCFCIVNKNQKCLKYFQTVEQDPWGKSDLPDEETTNRVKRFCDSLEVEIINIKIKRTKYKDYTFCPCSKTGKIICVKVNERDAAVLKQHKFVNN